MNESTFWRVFWKEYRQLRAFWLAIALFAVALEGIVVMSALVISQEIPVEGLFAIAMVLPVFYGLGAGAVLFAGEHEMETFDFQRALPVSAGKLVGGKLGFAIPSALLLPCLLWVTAWLFSGCAIPDTSLQTLGIWLASIGLSIELLAWGVLFSLLIGRVLWATVLATGCVSFLGILAIPGADWAYMRVGGAGAGRSILMLTLHIVVTLLVLAVDVWLGRRWLREAPFPWSRAGRRETADATANGHRSELPIAPFGRLLWHAWRQARGPLLLILATAAVLAAMMMIQFLLISDGAFRIPLCFAPVIAAIVGATAFWSDQRKSQYRFFTERGIGPRRVWASRLLIGLAAVSLWYLVAIVCLAGELFSSSSNPFLSYVEANALAHEPGHYELAGEAVLALLAFVGGGLLFFITGQICSLSIRSGVIGLFVGLMCSYLASMWALGMWVLKVPLWFSVAPIPLILLWASWLRAPDWMAERAHWRSRSKLALSIVVPLVAVLVAMVCFRFYEIPEVKPAISAQEMEPSVSAEGVKTLMLYVESHRELHAVHQPPSGFILPEGATGIADYGDERGEMTESDRKEAVELAVAKFSEASRREEIAWATEGRFSNQLDGLLSGQNLADACWVSCSPVALAIEVLHTCKSLEEEGRLEEAFERYLAVLRLAAQTREGADWSREYRADSIEAIVLQRLPAWAASEGQTAEAIRQALQRLDDACLSRTPTRRNAVVTDYAWDQHMLALATGGDTSGLMANEAFTIWFLSRFVPWEHGRVRRLVDIYTANELDRVQAVHDALAAGGTLPDESPTPLEKQLAGWAETTAESPFNIRTASQLNRLAGLCETRRRVVRLQLALAAWRAEHGQLPGSLDELIDSELDALPMDPFTGLPIQYLPGGAAAPLTLRNALDLKIWTSPLEMRETIDPETPFLWSAGSDLTYHHRRNSISISGEPDVQFSHANFTFRPENAQTAHWVTNDQELWSLGWCFPVR